MKSFVLFISILIFNTSIFANSPAPQLLPDQVAGDYINKRGDKAYITVTEYEPADLFQAPKFDIEIDYTPAGKSQAYILVDSDDLKWVADPKRPYFEQSIQTDCQDPDCYNSEGSIKFLQNKNGTYTLFLDVYYYNAAPVELGDEDDFEASSFLKRQAQLVIRGYEDYKSGEYKEDLVTSVITAEDLKTVYLYHYLFQDEEVESICYNGDATDVIEMVAVILDTTTGDSWQELGTPSVSDKGVITYPYSYVGEGGQSPELKAVIGRCQ